MPNNKTLFVVGAGASSEAQLPTGYELKEQIADKLDIKYANGYTQTSGDQVIDAAIRKHLRDAGEEVDINPYLHACWRVRDAMPQAISIDNFIDTHSDDKKIELCGKLAIVSSILEAERNSLLYVSDLNRYNKINFDNIFNTWYSSLMMLLTENCSKERLAERLRSVVFVVFNYDRCVEHFLHGSLMNYYGISSDEAGELVSEIEIYHPYGVVGELPWKGGTSVRFGATPGSVKLLALAGEIKTFTEGTDTGSSEVLAIRRSIGEAGKVIFLGFAYHKQNIALMSPEFSSLARPKCFGTAYGVSDSDTDLISRELKLFLMRESMSNITVNNKLSCTGLFKEYWRSLTFV